MRNWVLEPCVFRARIAKRSWRWEQEFAVRSQFVRKVVGWCLLFNSKEFAVLEVGTSILSPPINHSCSELYTKPQMNYLHRLRSSYIFVALHEELLHSRIIPFCVFIYCNWIKSLSFLLFWYSKEKFIPPKSSLVCITHLTNRYLPNRYFKWSALEGNWTVACATKRQMTFDGLYI